MTEAAVAGGGRLGRAIRRTLSPSGVLGSATLLLLAGGLLGAAKPPAKPAPPPAERRIVIGVRGDVTSFNIYTATNAFSQEVIDLLALRLAEEQDDFAQGPPTFKPGLASSWEFSPDRKTLTFHLDPKARWSDGAPVTSADVAFSYKAAASPEVAWVGSDVKEAIAEALTPDPRTVVFRFARVYPYQLMDAVEGNILPARVYGATPLKEWPEHPFLTAPVSSGPFLLKRYERGSLIELQRNPRYARAPLPRLDTVIFRVIPDETTLVNELLAGGIDFMENVPADAAAKIRAVPRLDLVRAPDLSYTFISWNTGRPLFKEARVRRALTMAIDREAIIEGLLKETGRPSAGPILSCMWACDRSLKPLPYDPEAAKRLLAEVGFKDSDGDGLLDRDGQPFRFELETNQGSGLRADIVQMVAAQLRKVGVEAVPRTFEFGAFIARHEKHDYDAFVGSWRESTKVDLKSAFHSASRTGGYNYGSYADAELDALIDKARLEADREAARKLWFKAQEIIARDQPLTFLFERDRLHAVPRDLTGLRLSPRSAYVGLEEWSLGGRSTGGAS
jgi:peptide/nickel transport system substrate-binding protein